MAIGANTNNPRGFLAEGRFSDQALPTLKLKCQAAAALVIKDGDPITITAGEAVDAESGDVIVGVAIGPAFVDLLTGDTVVLINPALPDVVFRVQDDVAAPALTAIGNAYDIDSVVNGAYTIDGKTAATNGDVAIIGIAAADDMGLYNEGDEQYRDVLVVFQNTIWNGQAPLAV